MKLWLKLTLAAGLVLSVFVIGAAGYQRDAEMFHFRWKIHQEIAEPVQSVPVTRGNVVRTIEAPGKVEAEVDVKISAQVMGRIISLPVKEGKVVAKDDVLAQLDREQYEAEVRSVESRISRLKGALQLAEADRNKSKIDYDLNRKLFEQRAISQTDLLAVETTYLRDLARVEMARAEIHEAESALRRANEDLQRTTIRSPMDGIVSQLLAKEGEVVVVGTMNNPGTVILCVSQPESLIVRARIDENSISTVAAGQRANIFLQHESVLAGTVLSISPKGLKAGGSGDGSEPTYFETRVKIDAPPPSVRMGMSATVMITVQDRRDVLTVPNQAVLHRRARDLPRELVEQADSTMGQGPGLKDKARRYYQVVFVESGSYASCRLVQTGTISESRTEILAGLAEGERVIVGPYRSLDKLREGMPVQEIPQTEVEQ